VTAVIAWQLLNGMSSIDSTSIIDEITHETVKMYGLLEADMEDNTIQSGKLSLYPDLSEDDALTHSHF
jgi:hypothetical protein